MGQVIENVAAFRLDVRLVQVDFASPPKYREDSSHSVVDLFTHGIHAIGAGIRDGAPLLKPFK